MSRSSHQSPLVIPVFIPHEGCPHSCIFCNQHRISGVQGKPVTAEGVTLIIEDWLGRDRRSGVRQKQVAFYGGSFTALPLERQQELLEAVQPFIRRGDVNTIRLSTRPDSMSLEIILFLQKYHVRIVELGVQSLDDQVLRLSGRGHCAEKSIQASKMLQRAGMELGLQLMIGLPGQNFTSLRKTIEHVLEISPDFVRIYPVLVLAGSGLERRYKQHQFAPLSLSRAVIQAAWMKKKFLAHDVRVVRMGLQPGPELEEAFIAGPYHPSFGELVNSRIMLQQTRKLLAQVRTDQHVVITISDRDQSVFRGMRRVNIHRLTSLGLSDRFSLKTHAGQSRGTVKLVTDTYCKL